MASPDPDGPGERSWLRWIMDPMPPGAGALAPRPRVLALLLMAGWLAAQVFARYRLGVLHDDAWAVVHVLSGWTVLLLILALFHGTSWLRRIPARTWVVIGAGLVFFCLFWYLGRIDSYNRWIRRFVHSSLPMAPLMSFFYFSAASVLLRLVLPLLFARFGLGLRPGDIGLWSGARRPGQRGTWPVYLVLFLAVLPFVVHAAGTREFLRNYPQCHELIVGRTLPLWQFACYQAAYLMVFVSGESFWRGFLSFGTERDLGLYGLAFMLVPYVVSHFGKPMPEALGAIVAGSVLGFLALKHRSVGLGVLLHYGVALSMDLLAMLGRGIVLH